MSNHVHIWQVRSLAVKTFFSYELHILMTTIIKINLENAEYNGTEENALVTTHHRAVRPAPCCNREMIYNTCQNLTKQVFFSS